MKLLLDQNLSYLLVASLESAFPGSKHVKEFGLTEADDESLWRFSGAP